METFQLSDKLEKFLIEKGVKEQFIYNCEHNSLKTKHNAAIDRIDIAFLWHITIEGNIFWAELSREFNNIKSEPEPEDLRETQKKQILDYLKTGKSITKLEALKMFGCWNSGDAILHLRRAGHKIEMTMITNGKKRFASYKLIENGN